MIVFYIVMSILWGLLMFLNSFRTYKWYVCLVMVIGGVLFWPLFVLIEVITTAINEFKRKPSLTIEASPAEKREAVLDIIRENLNKNE